MSGKIQDQDNSKLNKYTSFPFMLDMLKRKKLVLTKPSSWEDKNDVEVIKKYCDHKGVQVFAACFCIGDETIHHWRTYAGDIWGCCIQYDKSKLINCLPKSQVRYKEVEYLKLKDVNENPPKEEDYPFIKRHPYRFENEFRIIWEGFSKDRTVEIEIDPSSITKITLSQRLPRNLRLMVKKLLKSQIRDLPPIKDSTLYKNKRWIQAFK